jgi:methylglutaconyl-CoA hydratase
MSETILTEIDRGIGIITLNRAERHNAFDDALIRELSQALTAMDTDPAVRVVVLSSTGKSFCAGADLNWMKRAAGYSAEETQRDALGLAGMLRLLNEMRNPPWRACRARPTAAASAWWRPATSPSPPSTPSSP